MSRFDPREHMRRRIHRALRALMYEDGFSAEDLADMASTPIGTFRSYVPEDYFSAKAPPSDTLMLLASRLASEWRNYRLVTMILPTSDSIVHDAPTTTLNGLDDELQEGAKAVGLLASAIQAQDPDMAEDAINKIAEVVRQGRHEVDYLRSRKERVRAGATIDAKLYGGDGH